jgi:hypothetical protein
LIAVSAVVGASCVVANRPPRLARIAARAFPSSIRDTRRSRPNAGFELTEKILPAAPTHGRNHRFDLISLAQSGAA